MIGDALWNDQSLKIAVCENMRNYGGSFVVALSECLIRADQYNIYKLSDAFPEYILQYAPEKWTNQKGVKKGDVVKEIFRQLEPWGVQNIVLDGVPYRR